MFAARVQGEGGERRVAIDSLVVVGQALDGVMKQVAVECSRRRIEMNGFVDERTLKPGLRPVVQPGLPVGIPAAVQDPPVDVARPTCHAISGPAGSGIAQRPDRLRELGRDAFVGVHAEDPVVCRFGSGAVLLRGIARPVGHDDAIGVFARNLDRPVGRTGVDHDDLVRPVQGFERFRDLAFLVACDDRCGDLHAGRLTNTTNRAESPTNCAAAHCASTLTWQECAKPRTVRRLADALEESP